MSTLSITRLFALIFGVGLAIICLLLLIVFCSDCGKKSRVHIVFKIIAITGLFSSVSHCILLYYVTLTLHSYNNNNDTYSSSIAWQEGAILLTEYISRVSFYILFMSSIYNVFNKSRFALSRRFIFFFSLLITSLLILIIIVIFDYQINDTFTELDKDMQYIYPIVSTFYVIINIMFFICFIKKLYQITYIAFYQVQNIDINVQNRDYLISTTACTNTNTTSNNNDKINVISPSLSALSIQNQNQNQNDDDDDDDDISSLSSHYWSNASKISTVIPFKIAQKNGNIMHVNKKVKMIDIMSRTVVLSFFSVFFIQFVIIYRVIINIIDFHTNIIMHNESDNPLKIIMCLSMFVNGIAISLNFSLTKRIYKLLCLRCHHCLEMICVKYAKRNINKNIIKEYVLNVNANNYRQLSTL